MSKIPEPKCAIYKIQPKTEGYSAIYRVVGYVDFFFGKEGDFDGIEFKLNTEETSEQAKLSKEFLEKLTSALEKEASK